MDDEALATLNRLVAEINALEQSGRLMAKDSPAASDATVDAICIRLDQLKNFLEEC